MTRTYIQFTELSDAGLRQAFLDINKEISKQREKINTMHTAIDELEWKIENYRFTRRQIKWELDKRFPPPELPIPKEKPSELSILLSRLSESIRERKSWNE